MRFFYLAIDQVMEKPFSTASWIHLILVRCHPFGVLFFIDLYKVKSILTKANFFIPGWIRTLGTTACIHTSPYNTAIPLFLFHWNIGQIIILPLTKCVQPIT